MTSSCPNTISSALTAISPSPPPPPFTKQMRFSFSTRSWGRSRMSSDREPPPVPDRRVVLGCGSVTMDFLAAVAYYPKPDDKIRSTSLKVQGGGNAGNALTCAARLGLNPRLISKVADDAQGRGILEELEADGVDTSFLVVSKEGNSPFTYVIVDDQTKTRTCIHTPGYPPMVPHDLSQTNLLSAIDGARIVYFDGRLYETALVVAKEAVRRNIPILIDAERPREGLDDLLKLAAYAVCSAKFPQASWFFYEAFTGPCKALGGIAMPIEAFTSAWTNAPSVATALVSLMLRLPNMRFIIVTLGAEGCIMLERSIEGSSREVDVDNLLEILKQRKDDVATIPTCVSSSVSQLQAEGIGTLHGRLLLGTAEKIPPQELIDTTGAGDAFIGATLYAVCANMSPEKLLPFAAQVAAANCRALGARTSLPYPTDPRLAPFLS